MNYVNKYNAILFEGDLNSNQIVRTWSAHETVLQGFFRGLTWTR
jgi:hypothetical protein